MVADEEGFYYPSINQTLCTGCGLCRTVCSYSCHTNTQKAYACFSTQKDLQFNSSSGGIIGEISSAVIRLGGIVFGCVFDANFQVMYTYTENEGGLIPMRCSKYVQGRVNDSYRKVEEYLQENKSVLFVGTGCQIHGLKAFLKKEYDNLLCIDFICHGVPSPLVWGEYLSTFKKRPKQINFRSKESGWKDFSLKIEFNDGCTYKKLARKDAYMRCFLKNLILRPSCYNCQFKGESVQGDLTVGDFWNVSNVEGFCDDNRGVSMVLVNNQKGSMWFKRIEKSLWYKQVDKELVRICNPSLFESASQNPERKDFFLRLQAGMPMKKLLQKYSRDHIGKKVVRKIRVIIAVRGGEGVSRAKKSSICDRSGI